MPPATYSRLGKALCQNKIVYWFQKGSHVYKSQFKPLDPLPQSDLPLEIEFTQEMSIKEVKRRYPDAHIPREDEK